MTFGSILNISKLALKCSGKDWFDAFPQEVPVMIISGGKDVFGGFGRGIISLDKEFTQRGIYTTTKVYPGLRHEVLGEDTSDAVLSDIQNWLVTL